MDTTQFAQYELDTKVRTIIRDVLKGFVDKLNFFNASIAKHTQEMTFEQGRVTALQHRLVFFEEKYSELGQSILSTETTAKQAAVRQNSAIEQFSHRLQEACEMVASLKQNVSGNNDRVDFIAAELDLNRTRIKDLQNGLIDLKSSTDERVKQYIETTITRSAEIKLDCEKMHDHYEYLTSQVNKLKEQSDANIRNYQLFVHEKEVVREKMLDLQKVLDEKQDAGENKVLLVRVERQAERRLHQAEKQLGLKIAGFEATTKSLEGRHGEMETKLSQLESKLTRTREQHQKQALLFQSQHFEENSELTRLAIVVESAEAKLASTQQELLDKQAELRQSLQNELRELESVVLFTKSEMIARVEEKVSLINEVLYRDPAE